MSRVYVPMDKAMNALEYDLLQILSRVENIGTMAIEVVIRRVLIEIMLQNRNRDWGQVVTELGVWGQLLLINEKSGMYTGGIAPTQH